VHAVDLSKGRTVAGSCPLLPAAGRGTRWPGLPGTSSRFARARSSRCAPAHRTEWTPRRSVRAAWLAAGRGADSRRWQNESAVARSAGPYAATAALLVPSDPHW